MDFNRKNIGEKGYNESCVKTIGKTHKTKKYSSKPLTMFEMYTIWQHYCNRYKRCLPDAKTLTEACSWCSCHFNDKSDPTNKKI